MLSRKLIILAIIWLNGCGIPSDQNLQPSVPKICEDSGLYSQALHKLQDLPRYYFTPRALANFSGTAGSSSEVQFLTSLCSLYKDSPLALQARMGALSRLVRPREQSQSFDILQPLWQQITAPGYRKFLKLSENLSKYRLRKLPLKLSVRSNSWDYDPLPPLSVCETQFIFEKYLNSTLKLDSEEELQSYEQKREEYSKVKCSEKSRQEYYLFRGESGIVPSLYEARGTNLLFTDDLKKCRAYETGNCSKIQFSPLSWRVERSLTYLRAMLFYPQDLEDYVEDGDADILFNLNFNQESTAPVYLLNRKSSAYANLQTQLDILKNASLTMHGTSSHSYRTSYKKLRDAINNSAGDSGIRPVGDLLWKPEYARQADQGLSSVFYSSSQEHKNALRKRLKLVFNRNLDYYGMNALSLQHKFFSNRFTSWLSTSSYPHLSQKFTKSGFNRDTKQGQQARWLTVFKVAGSNLYTRDSLQKNVPIDFSRHWFEEKSFASDSLATSELSWSKFIGPDPEEIDTILLLDQVYFSS